MGVRRFIDGRCGFSTAWGALPLSNLIERYFDKIKHLPRVVHPA